MNSKLNKSAFRTIQLLEIISEDDGISQNKLRERLGIPKSSLHELLTTLLYVGAIVYSNSQRTGYRIGPKLLQFVSPYLTRNNENVVIHSHLQKLTQKFNACTYFAVRNLDHIVYVDKIEGSSSIKIIKEVGSINHLHSTGLGKAILACMPDHEVMALMENKLVKKTQNTLINMKSLIQDLKNARQKGFTVDDQEDTDGIYCVAAPIRNILNEIVGAISITGFVYEINEEASQLRGKAVREVAQRISLELGFNNKNIFGRFEE